jgi:coenzyme F420-reducing hydrogenase alpha subunit
MDVTWLSGREARHPRKCDLRPRHSEPGRASAVAQFTAAARILQRRVWHALSLFHLSSPDLMFGMDRDPTKSNIFGVAEKNPELALDGIRLRQFGQKDEVARP